jgi:D-alanyl-D-alanine carboxypeptidase/D-alanyl-D-alanine-endopeptidase (penicillin-binding protein 4)
LSLNANKAKSSIAFDLTTVKEIFYVSVFITKLEFLANKLQEQGIKQINQLTVIDGYLPPPVTNESWEYFDISYYYAVPVNSLILNENTVTLNLLPSGINQLVKLDWDDEIASKQWVIKNEAITANKDAEYNINITPIFTTSILKITGELPFNSEADEWMLAIPQPDLYFLESLKQILNSNDIFVKKTQVINNKNTDNEQVNNNLFFEFISPNLTELITIINQESNNLYAEVLLKYLGVDSQGLNQFASLVEILTKLGLEENSYQLEDGSGLSRHNLITPLALVELLELMANSEYNDIFLNSLAVAGKTGTLKNRFQDTVIVDQFYGKTGTLSGISALSGYLKRENQDTLVISIIINNSTEKSSTLRKIIDEIVLLFSTTNFNCNN